MNIGLYGMRETEAEVRQIDTPWLGRVIILSKAKMNKLFYIPKNILVYLLINCSYRYERNHNNDVKWEKKTAKRQ